jgi:hypothetical protein
VLRGIEDLKVKGFRPDQMQDKIMALVKLHLEVRMYLRQPSYP